MYSNCYVHQFKSIFGELDYLPMVVFPSASTVIVLLSSFTTVGSDIPVSSTVIPEMSISRSAPNSICLICLSSASEISPQSISRSTSEVRLL